MPRCLPLVLLAISALTALPAAFGAPADAGPVYFWPMAGALDQYLAEQFQSNGVYAVTVDPKLARTVMTDRIDAVFLGALDELFPLPGGEPSEDAEQKSDDSLEGDFRMERPKNRPVARSQGTLFLVDIKTRKVLWSTYLKEYNRNPNALNKQAREVVARLQKELVGQ